MGWREVLAKSQYVWDMGVVGGEQIAWEQYRQIDPEYAALYETCAVGHSQALLSMPAADRIALARELLQGTGRVVARDVGEWPDKRAQLSDAQGYYRAAWNACRAKMLEDEP